MKHTLPEDAYSPNRRMFLIPSYDLIDEISGWDELEKAMNTLKSKRELVLGLKKQQMKETPQDKNVTDYVLDLGRLLARYLSDDGLHV
ncbi:unnamed protein product [Ilex paraguariensis]|uniref:Uncharacterized protein n=1 Tax=Ilex paraguariensis TaxID=185542 RepID=A0ABC8UMX8_9AQUA